MTPGVAALGPDLVERVIKTLAAFDDFHHANDPHEEHDFGAFEVDGHKLFFKIDYYDKSLAYHSPDPADPSVTERVITLIFEDRYEAALTEIIEKKQKGLPIAKQRRPAGGNVVDLMQALRQSIKRGSKAEPARRKKTTKARKAS